MRRREFIFGLAMLANVGRASAQGRARRVGALIAVPAVADVLETSLREKGWILGRNLQIEYRLTRGDTNLSQAYAWELMTNANVSHVLGSDGSAKTVEPPDGS